MSNNESYFQLSIQNPWATQGFNIDAFQVYLVPIYELHFNSSSFTSSSHAQTSTSPQYNLVRILAASCLLSLFFH